MPKIKYRNIKFTDEKRELINHANEIIAELAGYELTLRQLYYQFVTRNLIENKEREYKNLGNLISDARLAGLIDWEAIVDRTRNVRSLAHWETPEDIISACAKQYRIDKWAEQKHRIECWIEKDALVGVIENICNELDIAYFSCRGYTSQSEMWAAAQRLREHLRGGQVPIILHLGDHDPSGKDMTRDIEDRLAEFTGREIEVRRLALNMDQIEQYGPPPNPAKVTDPRANDYRAEFGNDSWELDALRPDVLVELIRNEVFGIRDADKWAEASDEEDKHREALQKVSDKWSDIVESLD